MTIQTGNEDSMNPQKEYVPGKDDCPKCGGLHFGSGFECPYEKPAPPLIVKDSMNPQIPEDLKIAYKRAKSVVNSEVMICNVQWLIAIIERIARLEQEIRDLEKTRVKLRPPVKETGFRIEEDLE